MKVVDIVGHRYGRLTVLRRGENKGIKPGWECLCECGSVKTYNGSDLKLHKVQSCGCLRNERVRATIRTHGDASRSGKRPEYNVWLAMRSRCVNPNNKDYRHYGGRGIAVSREWQESYSAFIAVMGLRPSPQHTIDRIDVNGNYGPENCRWATWSEQRRNTRDYLATRMEG